MRYGHGAQKKGKPVIVKSETVYFSSEAYKKTAGNENGNLDHVGSSNVTVKQGPNVLEVKEERGGIVSLKGKEAGQATIQFQLKDVAQMETAILTVIEKLDEFNIHFHFLKAIVQPSSQSVTTLRIDDISDFGKRQSVVSPMIELINKYWEQAGIKFKATHGVVFPTPGNEDQQEIIDSTFNQAGDFKPPGTTQFFTIFNKADTVNVYIIRKIDSGDPETVRGITALAKGAGSAVYKGGVIVDKTYGIVISDAALEQDVAHEIGHLLGLRDRFVGLHTVAPSGTIKMSEFDGVDRINHRVENMQLKRHNLMRSPIHDKTATFLYLTEGQARHARKYLTKLYP